MTKSIYKIIILLFFIIKNFSKVTAQASSQSSIVEIGMDIGGMVSLSPLTPYGRLGAWKQISAPSIDFFIERNIVGPLSLRGKLFLGSYGEDDSKTQGYSNWNWLREWRKIRFETSVKEITGMLVYNFLNGNTESLHTRKLSAYIFAGAGVAFVNVQRNWNNFDTAYFSVQNPGLVADLARDTLHALPNKAFVMPLGGGLKYVITSQWSLLFEANFRYTTQQYLDGFYNLGNNQANKGYNLKKDDYYYGVSVGVSYKISLNSSGNGRRLDCPRMVW